MGQYIIEAVARLSMEREQARTVEQAAELGRRMNTLIDLYNATVRS